MTYLAVASQSSLRITIYKKNGETFTKLPAPDESPGFIAEDVDFNYDSTLMAVANWGGAAPNIIIYRRDGDLFAKLPDPVEIPKGQGLGVSFSHDSRYMAIAHLHTPYITIYKIGSDAVDKTVESVENDWGKEYTSPLADIKEEQINNAIAWAKNMNHMVWQINDGYYGNCLQFAQHAYILGAKLAIKTGYDSAINAAYALGAEMNKDNEPPPSGVWIFYTVEHDPDGHAAIPLGEGQMIHVNTDVEKGTAKVEVIGYKDL